MDGHPLLEARELTVQRGGVAALDAVNVAFAPGELVGVTGAAGAGKTTFVDALCGLVPPSSGDLFVAGARLTGAAAQRFERQGIVRWASVASSQALQQWAAQGAAAAARVLLLDEPAAGLAAPEAYALAQALRRLRDEHDLTVIRVERDSALLLSAVERVLVLHAGRKVADGTPAEVVRDGRIWATTAF